MYLFNPDNDLALANFGENYMPPLSARKIGEDLTVLPVWYAPSGSCVLSDNQLDAEFLARMNGLFQLDAKLLKYADLTGWNKPIYPWGWNPTLRKRLLNLGVEIEMVPSKQYLTTVHDYSNRKHAVAIHRELLGLNQLFCGDPHFFTDVDSVLYYLSKQSDDCVLKMPLSGSGKGLVWIKNGITDKQTDWCRKVILNQNGVVAEPVLCREQDFAMEFSMHNCQVSFEGYSLFNSASSGAYMGNQLLSDKEIEHVLSKYVAVDELNDLRDGLLQKLKVFFPDYVGFLGVDMMICNIDGKFYVHPCLEVNMRMNMGLVAHRIKERFVNEQSGGFFGINYFKREFDALLFEQQMIKENQPEIYNNQIFSGYLPLNPVDKNTRYVAYALIKKNDVLLT